MFSGRLQSVFWFRGSAARCLCGLLLSLLACCALPLRGQGLLQEIQKRGVLRIGTDATYPPFETIIHENGKDRYEGFDIDFGEEIGRELGVKVEWININFDNIFTALQGGKFDLVISDVVITPTRKKSNWFTRPYFLAGEAVVKRKGDARIQTSKDLVGKTVAVQLGTTGQEAVQKLGLPPDSIHKKDNIQDALFEVVNSRADAVVADFPVLQFNLAKSYSQLELTGGIFVHENYSVVVHQNERALLDAANRAIEHILTDGRYARLHQKWLGEPITTSMLAELDVIRGAGTATNADIEQLRRTDAESAQQAQNKALAGGQKSPASAFAIDWTLFRRAFPLLLRGVRLTLILTLIAIGVGTIFGLLIALARLSKFPLLTLPAVAYVELMRGTPLLVQIIVIFDVLPAAGINLSAFQSASLALCLNAAAYISEIIRAGIESIDAGQMEAARSLGMDYVTAMRWVILPQTFRRILPPLTNEAVALLKDTSIVSIVGLGELSRQGRELVSSTGSPITIYLAVALLYLLVTLPLTYLVRRLEVQWQPISSPRERKRRAVQSTLGTSA